jgi:short-subunit dehydrogenase
MADLIHEVVPMMKKQKSGHIINVSSYASSIAIPPLTIYASTKYAIEGLTDALRRELSPWNIKLTRVHPWAVATNFNKKASKNGIPFPMKVGIFFRNLTEVSPEKVADEIVNVIEKPKIAVYIGKMIILVKFIAFVNRHFPSVVDFFYKFYVKKMAERYKTPDKFDKLG